MTHPTPDRTPADAERRRRLLDRLAAAQAALAAEGDRPARAGDLFALPATAAWPVEWAVAGPAPGAPGSLIAVPADHHPLAGGGDVVIPEDAPAGPLTVRCRFPVPVAAGELRAEWRSGLLAPETAAEIVRTLAALEAGGRTAGEKVESSPEYRGWVAEVIAPACAALAAAGGAAPIRGTDRRRTGLAAAAPAADAAVHRPPASVPDAEPARRRRRGGEWHRALPLAASVLLAVGLALAGGLVVQSQRLERFEAEAAAGERRLHAEIETLEEAGRRDAEVHRREVERLIAERDAALAAGEAPPAPPPRRPQVNLPFAWLRPEGDATRGEPPAVEIPATAGLVALILPIDDRGRFERFRLEILRGAAGEPVWETDELVLTGLAETSLALPGSLLPPGDYTLHLAGLGDGDPAPLATYRLRIAGDPSG